MARILGIEIPDQKRALIGLTYIYGIGQKKSKVILENAKIDHNKKVFQLDPEEKARILQEINKNHQVEGSLKAEKLLNIKRLIDIDCYRGRRHRKGLPVRGQRTKNNCRAHKGPKKNTIKKRK